MGLEPADMPSGKKTAPALAQRELDAVRKIPVFGTPAKYDGSAAAKKRTGPENPVISPIAADTPKGNPGPEQVVGVAPKLEKDRIQYKSEL